MKKLIMLLCGLLAGVTIQAQNFDDYFIDKSLRVDYIFTGNFEKQEISLDKLSSLPAWAGRRHHLGEVPLMGNGQVIMRDAQDGTVIYMTSFSTLFQEWLAETEEAKQVTKSFEYTVLLPFPQRPAVVEIKLLDGRHDVRATLTHTVLPDDILIEQKGLSNVTPHKYILKSGDSKDCIDIAFLAEGYTEDEMDIFYKDAEDATESLFSHEPYTSMRDRFNIVAVASPSKDSGVSIPKDNIWKQTAFGSHFSTFYSDRYLTTTNVKQINDALAGIPYEHIIILANSEVYGGGGVYNSFTLSTAHNALTRPVIVHEFGHSFGGLADEYAYEDDVTTDSYPLDVEPWEQNITTQVDFAGKWADLVAPGTPNPTPVEMAEQYPVGLYEGASYSLKGMYRPSFDCRMRSNVIPNFCPVCERAIRKIIEFYTDED
ncbi:MAG: IgA Peptidase M64 [Prevotellaceae bacterium]|nr:IgA Peptidase M64 [Prevotellaceae bacterium]